MRFTTSKFRRVFNVVFFLLGDSLVYDFYMPTFRNNLAVPHSDTILFLPHIRPTCYHLRSLPSTICFSTQTRPLSVYPSYRLAQAIFGLNLYPVNTPTISSRLYFLFTPSMKKEQCVPKVDIRNSGAGKLPKRKNTT